MHRAQRLEPQRLWGRVSLVLLSDRGIREVNGAFLGRGVPTDVMAFAYPPGPADRGRYEGEVLVNVQRAWQEGRRRRGPSHELALYVAHGCDHLAGRDDATAAEALAMRRRENRWLRTSPAQVDNLFEAPPC